VGYMDSPKLILGTLSPVKLTFTFLLVTSNFSILEEC
jgi:hypothetical protein